MDRAKLDEEDGRIAGMLNNCSTSSSLMVNPADGASYGATSGSELSFSRSFSFGLSSQQLKIRCKKLFVNRIPKGRAPLVVFLLNIIETFCFYGGIHLINDMLFGGSDSGNIVKIPFYFNLFEFTAGRICYPLAGLVADVHLGRHRVIQIGLWLFGLAFTIYLISQSAELNKDTSNSAFKIFPAMVTVLFILGSACVEATIIPFGMDQVQQGASSEELSSYFYWYYFGRQLGYLLSVLVYILLSFLYFEVGSTLGVYGEFDMLRGLQHITIAVIAAIFITGGILLLFFSEKWLYKARQRENPLKLVAGVLSFAALVKRKPPQYRRSFRYGEGRLPRIELAKMEYDGAYSSEEVEDVKTFVQILFIIICLGGTFATYSSVIAIYTSMLKNAKDEDISITPDHKDNDKFDFFALTQPFMVCLIILVLNNLILPFFPDMSMKKRLGCGAFFVFLSVLSGIIIVIAYRKLDHPFFWIFLPVAVFSIGDTLVFVTGLEFISAQAPDSMKGLLIGLFYCIFGIFSSMGITVYYKLYRQDNGRLHYFFYVMLAVSLVGVVVYILGAMCYKNRQRPTNDDSEQDLINRSIAAEVYLSGRHR